MLPIREEHLRCRLKLHSVLYHLSGGFEPGYPEPRCFSCSPAACVDHDELHFGSPQARRAQLVPDVDSG